MAKGLVMTVPLSTICKLPSPAQNVLLLSFLKEKHHSRNCTKFPKDGTGFSDYPCMLTPRCRRELKQRG